MAFAHVLTRVCVSQPLQFHLLTSLGDNTSVAAPVGRRRMCMPPRAQDWGGTDRTVCSCEFAQSQAITPPCGCGCRELLKRSGQSDFDMCVNRAVGDAEPDIMCGPLPSSLHRRIEARDALMAQCVAPPTLTPGAYELEYAPMGDVRSTSNSKAQKVDFTYYQTQITSVAPLAVPLDGGTRFVINGMNLAPFAAGTRIGEANIYGVPSQVRTYDAQPLCFLGSRSRAVAASLEQCTNTISGWRAGDEATSGCSVLRCMPTPPMEQAGARSPCISPLLTPSHPFSPLLTPSHPFSAVHADATDGASRQD